MSAGQLVGPNAIYPGLPAQTSIQQIIPAYVYQEYADDDNVQAFTIAQNQIADEYLLWFNTLNLPIYTGGIVAGKLLDWVGQGIYGISRPSITTGMIRSFGAMNSFPMDVVAMNSRKLTANLANQLVNDDIYRRVLTWNLYKGDGFVFCAQWLRRRVLRFLNGPNGIAPTIDQTYAVSVSVSGTTFTVTIPTGNPTTVALLNSLIKAGFCITPFQYTLNLSV